MKISARFGGGGYIRPGAIYVRGLYTDRSDISGEILQKISKSLYFAFTSRKNFLHVVFI